MSEAPFAGLEPGTELVVPAHRRLGKPDAVYTYVSAHGAPLFASCRFQTPEGKTFSQGHPTAGGAGWAWDLKGVEPVLYHLDEVVAHLADGSPAPLYIVEGEKACDYLRAYLTEHRLPGTVTTSPMGAGKWRESYSEALEGARWVIVVVDNDKTGIAHGRAIEKSLKPLVDRFQLLRPALDHAHAGLDDHLVAGLSLDDLIPLEELLETPHIEVVTGPVFTPLKVFLAEEEIAPPALWGTEEHSILVQGGLGLFAGRPGVGKTTFIVDLTVHLAAGIAYPPVDPDRPPKNVEPWPVWRPLKIALIENEGPRAPFRDKVRRKLESFPHADVAVENITVQTRRWGAFTFADPALFEDMLAELDEDRIDLVIGDPLGNLGTEGVGSPDETGRFVQRLRGAGLGTMRAFLLIHHFRTRTERDEDELSRVSGAWGQHPDALITLANTGSEAEALLTIAKLRWSTAELPKPAILGRVFARAGFELQGLADDETMLEPKLVRALEERRIEGRGWATSTELAKAIGKGKSVVPKVLEGAPHLFVMRTGAAAVELGAKQKSTKLWGLKDWAEEPEPPAEPGQEELDWR